MKRSVSILAVLLCAWVLWEDLESTRGGTRERTIRPIDASESRADCQTMLANRLDEVSARTSPNGWKRSKTAKEFFESNPDGTLTLNVRLLCLPDVTDPRPRTGT